MKTFGFHLVQNKNKDDEDFLVYPSKHDCGNGEIKETSMPLETVDGILMLRTKSVYIDDRDWCVVNKHIKDMRGEEKPKGEYLFTFDRQQRVAPVLMVNEAEFSLIEQNRLQHWRYGHRGKRHKERCPTCEQAKHKTGSFKRNISYFGTSESTLRVYWRLWCNAYGGQSSIGPESHQGAAGGFVFVCPVSGKIKVKLYATTKQFPAVLFQVPQEIETEGYVCREIYVDTFSVNLSKAAKEVVAIFKCRIVPVSSGTPQEMAYAERAVQTVAQMSRALLLGAPHLPEFCWGLSDLYAVYLHTLLPQKSREGKTPYQITTGRIPDEDVLFVRVFGWACQYEPHDGALHKRASKTEWGWFVGIQWPMVLILRPVDEKVISVSRKKVHCHEMAYAKFNHLTMTKPPTVFNDFTLTIEDVDTAIIEAEKVRMAEMKAWKDELKIPKHVLSTKSMSDFARNPEFNTATPQIAPPQQMTIAMKLQSAQLGEESDLHLNDSAVKRLTTADLLEVIGIWRNQQAKGSKRLTETEEITRLLKELEWKEQTDNEAPKRGGLKTKGERKYIKLKST